MTTIILILFLILKLKCDILELEIELVNGLEDFRIQLFFPATIQNGVVSAKSIQIAVSGKHTFDPLIRAGLVTPRSKVQQIHSFSQSLDGEPHR